MSEDFKIEHNSDENYIDSNSGHIYIRANVNDDEGDNIYLQPKSGENGIIVTHDGSVELYHDAQKTFETFANGIVVRSGGEGNDGEIQLYADQGDDNADYWRLKSDTSGLFGVDSYATGSWVNKLQVNPSGTIVTGVSTADGFRVGDSEYISVGAGGTGDMLLYHNGTNSFIDNSTGNMQITCNEFRVKSKTGGEAHIQSSDEGDVQLYYDGSIRFATTDDGADVSGTASIKIPVGTTAQRNSSPANGDIRYNTTLNSYEGYGNGAWGGLGGGTEIDNTIATTTATGISTFVKTDYRSAYFRLQITQGSAYQVGRYLLIHDGTTATLIEESAIATGSMLGSVTAAVVSSNVIISINMASSSSATITHIIDKITV